MLELFLTALELTQTVYHLNLPNLLNTYNVLNNISGKESKNVFPYILTYKCD